MYLIEIFSCIYKETARFKVKLSFAFLYYIISGSTSFCLKARFLRGALKLVADFSSLYLRILKLSLLNQLPITGPSVFKTNIRTQSQPQPTTSEYKRCLRSYFFYLYLSLFKEWIL